MASDPYYAPTYVYKKVVSYETVTSYQTRSQAYQVAGNGRLRHAT